MQPIIWQADFKDGSQVLEFDENGKETVFTEILPKKSELSHFGLIDCVNDLVYSIDLTTGEFILNGLPINLGKEVDGRTFRLTNLPVNYGDGIIQYKCSNPVEMKMGNGNPIAKATAATYNVGYKVKTPAFKFPRENNGKQSLYEVEYFQPMLSINANDLRPTVTVTVTVKITDSNGNSRMVKI